MSACGGGCVWDWVSDWDSGQCACRTDAWWYGTHDGSVLSMLELPGRGLAIAAGANMTARLGQYSSLSVCMSLSEAVSVENQLPGRKSIWRLSPAARSF